MTTYRRPVSTIEKVFLAFDRLRPPFANQIVVEGVGRIDADTLAAACAEAAKANPGCTLRLEGSLGGMAWVPGEPPRVTVVRDVRWDGRSEDRAVFLDKRLDRAGPSCEVQLIEAETRTYLVFRSLHAAMDGLGTILWGQEVFRALRGEPLIGYPSDMTDVQFAKGLNAEPLVMPKPDALHPCGRADAVTSGNDFRWCRVTVAAPAEVPVVATLAVTIARAARRHESGIVRVNIPADLRFAHKDQRTTGNAIGTLFVEIAPEATVADVANDIKTRLRAKEHARRPGGYAAMRFLTLKAFEDAMGRGFATEHESGRYATSATLSSLGKVDADTLCAPGFTATTAFAIPPMSDQTCFVTVTGFGGHLELLLAMPRVLGTRGRFEALQQELVAAITAAGASVSSAASGAG